jgi:hypothetical protein
LRPRPPSPGEEKEEGLEKYNLEAGDSLADIYDRTTLDYLKGENEILVASAVWELVIPSSS